MALPLLPTFVLLGLYFTPISVVGCLDRGIAAMAVSAGAGVGAVLAGRRASSALKRNDVSGARWLASTGILVLPLILLIWPLG